jgi:hypothetical protein
MLARAAGCARVTTQYELVCKAEISRFGLQALHEANDRVGEGERPDGLLSTSMSSSGPASMMASLLARRRVS